MYFEIDTDCYDAVESGADFVRSAEKEAEESEAFEFLTSAFGAMSFKQREDFLSFATEYHKFKEELENKHSFLDTNTNKKEEV